MAKIIVYGTKVVVDATKGYVCVASEGAPPPEYTDEAFFTFDPDTHTITGYSSEGPKDVVIPPTIGGVPVEVIGPSALSYMDLTSVILPDSLTTLAEYSMDNNLIATIEVPASVTTIGEGAFSYSPNLVQLLLPEGLEAIPAFLCDTCPLLSQINLPSTLTRIGMEAFARCALTSVTIPDSVIDIGSGAFVGLTQADITLGAGFSHFWLATGTRLDGAIGSDPNIPTVVNGEVMTELGDMFFFNNRFAPNTHITIPNGYEVIAQGAFQMPHNITEVFIPDSVRTIGALAFSGDGADPEFRQIAKVRMGSRINLDGGASFAGQPLTEITLGYACIIADPGAGPTFGVNGVAFRSAYYNKARMGGTYTYAGSWSMTPTLTPENGLYRVDPSAPVVPYDSVQHKPSIFEDGSYLSMATPQASAAYVYQNNAAIVGGSVGILDWQWCFDDLVGIFPRPTESRRYIRAVCIWDWDAAGMKPSALVRSAQGSFDVGEAQYAFIPSAATLTNPLAMGVSRDGNIAVLVNATEMRTYRWNGIDRCYYAVTCAAAAQYSAAPGRGAVSYKGDFLCIPATDVPVIIRRWDGSAYVAVDTTGMIACSRASFSGDGQKLVLVNTATGVGATYHWNSETDVFDLDATPYSKGTPFANIRTAAMSFDGLFMFALGNGKITVWKWVKGNGRYEELLGKFDGTIDNINGWEIDITPHGDKIAVALGGKPELVIYDLTAL